MGRLFVAVGFVLVFGCNGPQAVVCSPDAAAPGVGGSTWNGGSTGNGGSTEVTDASSAVRLDGHTPSDGAPYVPSAPTITQGDEPFTNPAGIDGTWVGYFENFQFPSGSDRLQLVFARDAAGASSLTVTLGDETPLAPPTAATEVWPPDGLRHVTLTRVVTPVERVPYPAHEVRWAGLRLTFKLDAAEAWAGWCGLQTSYPLMGPWGDTCFAGSQGDPSVCFRDGGGSSSDFPCAQYFFCSAGVCDCNATGCGPAATSVFNEAAFDMTFAMTLAGNTASGSALLSDRVNLHLAPAPAN